MAKRICGYCGHTPDGFASVTVGRKQVWLCHPDDETKPDCYTEWQRDCEQRNGESLLRLLDLHESGRFKLIFEAAPHLKVLS